jgi:CRP-like cAMP-binding protein
MLPQTNHSTHKNRILAALPQADLDRFFNELAPVSLSLKQILYPVGAPLEHVYFIEQGIASILTNMADGASIEVGMIGTEGIVGLPVLLGGEISGQQIIVQVSGTAQRLEADLCRTAFDGSAAVASSRTALHRNLAGPQWTNCRLQSAPLDRTALRPLAADCAYPVGIR